MFPAYRRLVAQMLLSTGLLILVPTPEALGQAAADKAEALAAYQRGQAFRKEGKLAEAIKEYERAVSVAPRAFGPDADDTVNLMTNLATLYRDTAQYAKAEALLQRCLKLRESRYGPDHRTVGTTLNDLALVCWDTGRLAEAVPLYQRTVKIYEAQLGNDHPWTAQTLNNLGLIHADLGQHAQAEPLYQRALQIREAKVGKDHVETAQTLNNLAGLYEQTGDYRQSEALYRRAIQIYGDRLGEQPDWATSVQNLARLYVLMGRYDRAESLYRRALQTFEARLGKDHPRVALAATNLADLYRLIGQPAQAEPLYQRALQIRETRLGKDHRDVAITLRGLADAHVAARRLAQAEPLYQRAAQILEARLGKDHSEVAGTLGALADLYVDTGRHAQAEPLYRRALQIMETQLGKDHPFVGHQLNRLGWFCWLRGQYEQAEPLYRRAIQIHEAQFGKDNPSLARSLNQLALLQASQERWDDANQTMDRNRRVLRRHISQVLPALSEPEQLTFLRSEDLFAYSNALSLGLLRRDEVGTAERSAGWVLNGKAAAQQALAEQILLRRDTVNPAVAEFVRRLLTVRHRLAALTLKAPKPGQEADQRALLDRLGAEEQELSKKLGQAGVPPARPDPWVDLGAVRGRLTADTVLVEIARFDVRNFRAKGEGLWWQPPRYAAWVVPAAGQGDVRIIDLGEAGKIDEAVAALRTALRQGPAAIRAKGEPEAEKELRGPLEALAKLVLHPLLPHVGKAPHWVISPDGELWLAPWAALPLPDGSYAVEKYQIRYVISGRELVAAPAAGAAARPAVFADPDYDLGVLVARAEAKKLALGATPDELRSAPPSTRLGPAIRLPGTAAEARAIVPRLEEWTKTKPSVYQDKQALEAAFKALRRPRVLVLSTHGFFLANQDPAAVDRPAGAEGGPVQTKEGKPLENPLLRCGLLLAGCNQRGQTQEADEDGVLTGLEIVGADLRGTELVVLSACETGIGEVRNGEGVAGLRQAFQLAGARSVLATLWQIPDIETARLMTDFFGQLADKKGKAEALREAQLAMIKARRDRNGAAHPFFWAAFTLTGQ